MGKAWTAPARGTMVMARHADIVIDGEIVVDYTQRGAACKNRGGRALAACRRVVGGHAGAARPLRDLTPAIVERSDLCEHCVGAHVHTEEQ